MTTIRQFIIYLSLIVVTACSSGRQSLSYFDNLTGIMSDTMDLVQPYELTIMPDDELVITVNSLDPKATSMFNLPLANPAVSSSLTESKNPTQQTFIVNQRGDINFPVLGRLHVEGMTTTALCDYLTELISETVKDPVVRVSLVNFSVNVIGEVNSPGIVRSNSERLSVLDAIASRGDISDYGVRDNILIIREIDGKRHFAHLNLKDANVVNSPYFYLRQNDVVYVTPNNIKEANSRYNRDNGYKLSVISTVVSAVSVITTLIIALTR